MPWARLNVPMIDMNSSMRRIPVAPTRSASMGPTRSDVCGVNSAPRRLSSSTGRKDDNSGNSAVASRTNCSVNCSTRPRSGTLVPGENIGVRTV